ncbi:MAG: NUMOD1 domain-containing DNA-binding protein [Candidatus Hodarchaeales archaeon]|jgi:DNA-binding CsgD family transcriptional regulator
MAKNIRSNKEAAKYCGISVSTISYHFKKGNLRRDKDKSFNLADLNRLKKRKQKKKKKPKTEIEQALEKGYGAKLKLYEGFTQRIMKGESLKPSELKHYHALEIELYGKTNGTSKESEVLQSNQEAAKYLGVSTRVISHHLGRGNITQNSDGTFYRSILDAQWKSRSKRNKLDDEIKKAELDYRIAKAEKERMITDRMNANLLSRKEVYEQWAQRVASVKQGLLNFIERLSPILEKKTRKQISVILEKEVDELLSSYSKIGEYNPRLKN